MTVDQSTGEVMTRPAGGGAAALLNGAAGGMTAAGRAEMARGVAEVLAQVQIAQAIPRDLETTLKRIKMSCSRYKFAEKAFYSYKRGGKTITGPSVKLIREIAAAFGNFQSGLVEVDRDEVRGFSMMMAFAWDVEFNSRQSSTFIVRAVRDLAPENEGGDRRKVPLFDERDIYEMNTNMGARRVREAIRTLLPAWLVDEASDLCNATLRRGPLDADGNATPLPVRMANAVERFASEFGVRKDQLEKFLEAPFDQWRDRDLARLLIIYNSLDIGDIRVGEVFPAEVTDEQLAEQAAARGPNGDGGQGEAEDEVTLGDLAGPLTARTHGQIETLFAVAGWVGDRNEARRRTVAGWLADQIPHGMVTGWDVLTEAHGRAAKAALDTIMAGDSEGRRAALDEAYTEARKAKTAADKAAKAAPAGPGPAEAGGQAGPDGGADAAASAVDPEGQPAEAVGGRVADPWAALGSRLADIPGLAGDRSAGRRTVVAGVLATGRYHPLESLGDLTDEQAVTALGNLDALAGKAGEGANLSETMKRLYEDALAQRDAPPAE